MPNVSAPQHSDYLAQLEREPRRSAMSAFQLADLTHADGGARERLQRVGTSGLYVRAGTVGGGAVHTSFSQSRQHSGGAVGGGLPRRLQQGVHPSGRSLASRSQNYSQSSLQSRETPQRGYSQSPLQSGSHGVQPTGQGGQSQPSAIGLPLPPGAAAAAALHGRPNANGRWGGAHEDL